MNDQELKASARAQLSAEIKRGDTIVFVRRFEGTATTGKYTIHVKDADTDTGLWNITGIAARLVGVKWNNVTGAVKCDAHLFTANLSLALFGDSTSIKVVIL